MTFFRNSVKKCALLLLICLINTAFCPAWADNGFTIKPVEEAAQVRLLAAEAWPTTNEQTELVFKLAYVRGLLDAWQLAAVAPKSSQAVLDSLQGINLNELVYALDNYYQQEQAEPKLPPASVILRIIPNNYKERLDNHE